MGNEQSPKLRHTESSFSNEDEIVSNRKSVPNPSDLSLGSLSAMKNLNMRTEQFSKSDFTSHYYVGMQLDVEDVFVVKGSQSTSRKWRAATVVDVNVEELKICVHYYGWSKTYDLWLSIYDEKISKPSTGLSFRDRWYVGQRITYKNIALVNNLKKATHPSGTVVKFQLLSAEKEVRLIIANRSKEEMVSVAVSINDESPNVRPIVKTPDIRGYCPDLFHRASIGNDTKSLPRKTMNKREVRQDNTKVTHNQENTSHTNHAAGPEENRTKNANFRNLMQSVGKIEKVSEYTKILIKKGSNSANIPHGFKNLGNTCYMNAILQCIRVIGPLNQYLLESSRESFESKIDQKYSIKESLSALVDDISGRNQSRRAVKPSRFKKVISKIDDKFLGYKQQDASELLMCIFDRLHEEVKVSNRQSSDLIVLDDDIEVKDDVAANICWKNHTRLHSSVVMELFHGQSQNYLKCPSCRYVSKTFDIFFPLPLSIPINISECTLDDCFSMYEKAEKLGEDEVWKCGKCKTKVQPMKGCSVWSFPYILVIQLKRFQNHGWKRSRPEKMKTHVDFPLRNLDLSVYADENSNGCVYDCIAVCNHIGSSMGKGHYTACVRCRDRWYECDDTHIRVIKDMSEIVTGDAYLLFYELQTS